MSTHLQSCQICFAFQLRFSVASMASELCDGEVGILCRLSSCSQKCMDIGLLLHQTI